MLLVWNECADTVAKFSYQQRKEKEHYNGLSVDVLPKLECWNPHFPRWWYCCIRTWCRIPTEPGPWCRLSARIKSFLLMKEKLLIGWIAKGSFSVSCTDVDGHPVLSQGAYFFLWELPCLCRRSWTYENIFDLRSIGFFGACPFQKLATNCLCRSEKYL